MNTYTSTDIANQVADQIGELTFDNIEAPTTTEEAILNRNYHKVRQSVLRQHSWNFAAASMVVTRTGTPPFDWTDKYDLPADFVRFISVDGICAEDAELSYKIEGRSLLMNNGGNASVKIRYVKDISEMPLWDSLAIDAFVLALAAKIAYKFTKSNTLAARLKQEYYEKLKEAVQADTAEQPPTRREDSRIRRRRRAFTGVGQGASLYEDRYLD